MVKLRLHRLRAPSATRAHAAFLAGLIPEIWLIRKVVRRLEIGLVQVTGLPNPHGAVAARLERIPVVWQLLDTRTPWLVAGVAMHLVRGLATTVMSTGWKVAMMQPGGRAIRSKVTPYFPPVDTELFRPRPELKNVVRSEWGIDSDSIVIGSVANLNPQKGAEYLIRAFVKLRETNKELRLVLIGAEYETQRTYSQMLRSELARAGLVENRDVLFAGARSDVDRQLQGIDIFALAAVPRSEGIPTVILEAMACGIPVVATNVGGVSEVVEHGSTGWLVRPQRPFELADALARLLRSGNERRYMGQVARDRAVLRFSISSSVRAHVRAYENALRGSPFRRTGLVSHVHPGFWPGSR